MSTYRAWLEYYVTTEDYDRSLPGRWSPHDPDCWMPAPQVRKLSIDFAHETLKRLKLDTDGSRTRREVGRMTYTQQRELLKRIS